MVVMAGRVVPMFTNNGVPGAQASRRPWLEKVVLGSTLALLACEGLRLDGLPLALLAGACSAANLMRWLLWQPLKTWRTPLVWVLHLAYLWIPVHLLMRSLAVMGLIPETAATHALTLGAMGGLIIGMMTRTALGHTARPLKAAHGDVVSYGLIAAGAAVRVAWPLLTPAHTDFAVLVSAALWSAGFATYAVRYWPMLTQARVDGRPG